MTQTAGGRWCFRAVRPFHAALDESLAVRSLDRFDWLPLPADSVLVVEALEPAAKHWKVYTEHGPKRSLRVRRREHPKLIEQLRENCLQSWRSEQPNVDAADDSPIRDRLRINRTEDDSG